MEAKVDASSSNNFIRLGDTSTPFSFKGSIEWLIWTSSGAFVPGEVELPSGYSLDPGATEPTPDPTTEPTPEPTPTPTGTTTFTGFVETFDNVEQNKTIRPDKDTTRNLNLDNPESFLRGYFGGDVMGWTDTGGPGTIQLGKDQNGQRMGFMVPNLYNAIAPVLKLTIKNDNGSGEAIFGLTLYVGNALGTSGSVGADGQRAHGQYEITNSTYQVIEITLDKARLKEDNIIQLRPVLNGSSTGAGGLYIDKIEVVEGS